MPAGPLAIALDKMSLIPYISGKASDLADTAMRLAGLQAAILDQQWSQISGSARLVLTYRLVFCPMRGIAHLVTVRADVHVH